MIFDRLNDTQKRALLSYAKMMMIVDAKVQPEEVAVYNVMEKLLGGELEMLGSVFKGDFDFSEFEDPISQKILLFTLNAMAHADGEFHETESALLQALSEQTKIYGGERDELLKLAEQQGKLFRKIAQFFG